MKLFVEHDRRGNIQSVSVVEGAGAFKVFPIARAGFTMSLVDVPGLKGRPSDPAFQRRIRALKKSFVVEVGPANLVKRGSKSGRRVSTGKAP